MPQIINTNIASLQAQRNLDQSQESLNTSLNRLSSGKRINSARDDAAGLAISNTFTSQIRGLNQAIRNANDGISLSQVAEGALQESTNILQRIRELAIQSANGTNTGTERAALQQEVSQLQQELNRIAETTSFGNRLLLDGSFGTETFQIGSDANQTISLTLRAATSRDLGVNGIDLDGTSMGRALPSATTSPANSVLGTSFDVIGNDGSANVIYSTGDSARSIAGSINAEEAVTGVSAEARTVARLDNLGSAGVISFILNGTGTIPVNVSANISDTSDLQDLATAINQQSATTGVVARAKGDAITLINEAGDDISIQDFSGGTSVDFRARNFDDTSSSGALRTLTSGGSDSTRIVGQVRVESSLAFNLSGVNGTVSSDTTSNLASVDQLTVGSQNGAQAAISVVDSAIRAIDSMRAGIGAVQNRLQSTIANLQGVSENASAARSRIQDADFAAETANLTRTQILQQAGIAILAQANTMPQQVLSLLQ
ncbi:MAG TPA: flagellin [Cellvibrionales bacterium]|nr:flagellin [Cellvibrionales bacterium]